VVIGRSSALTLALATLIDEMRAAFAGVATQCAQAPSGRAAERPGARESK
jgi:hypothetical protein